MSSPLPQDEQSIEFYKIQVMEKERQIADFSAKMKKVQFKHSRQLKEMKMAKERFEGLLKEEKGRSDRYNKLAQENIQQNQILQLRLSELKRDKEREIADNHAKYNSLKEQVRSYQRILPTFTFLNDIGRTIAELPNYEDLYVGLKEKQTECKQAQQALIMASKEWEDNMKAIRANEETLYAKKGQAEKNLKEIIVKLQQNQHYISDLKIQNDDLRNSNAELQDELALTEQRCQSLEDSIKDYEAKIQNLAEQFQKQLTDKEQQLIRVHHDQMMQIQDELRSQQALMQRKQAMFTEQLRLLQQEIVFLNNKYQTEIETFEQHYLCIKEETQRMRIEIANEKQRYDDLRERFDDSVNNLVKISVVHEEVEQKNRSLQHRIGQYEHQIARQQQKNAQQERSRYEQLQREKEELEQTLNVLNQHIHKIQQQRDRLEQENFSLREEISSKSFENNDSKSFLLDISKNIAIQQQKARKKQTEVEKIEQYQRFDDHTLNIPKSRRGSFNYDVAKIKELELQITYLNKKGEEQSMKAQQIVGRLTLIEIENQRLRQEIQSFRRERERMINEAIQLKEKIIYLTKASNNHQKAIYGNSTKNSLQKTKIQALQEEIRYLNEDTKRDKQAIRRLKEQNKSLKEQQATILDRLSKEIKDLSKQIETLKTQKDKLRQEMTSKERLWASELAVHKNNRFYQEQLREQIHELKLQKQAEQSISLQLRAKQAKLNSQLAILHKQIEKLQHSLKQSLRQNELANDSLERQRKQRSLLTVPSLHSISGELSQEENFNQIYTTIPQKQGEINLLQRQLMDCKEQIQTLRITQQVRMEVMEQQNSEYVHTIIEMKMRCAEAQMRASQKEYLYMQLKKRAKQMHIILK